MFIASILASSLVPMTFFLNFVLVYLLLTGNMFLKIKINPTSIYLFEVNNKNTRKKCEKCSQLTIMILEWRHHFVKEFTYCSGVSNADFKQVNAEFEGVKFWLTCKHVSTQPVFACTKSALKTMCEICSRLTIKKAELRHCRSWCLYCQLWTDFTHCSGVSTVEISNASWEKRDLRFQNICLITPHNDE